MIVTKEMVHNDLKPLYDKHSKINFLFKGKKRVKVLYWLTKLLTKGKNIDNIDCNEIYIPSSDGKTQIRTRVYRPQNCENQDLPAVFYYHGGGYMTGTPEQSPTVIKGFLDARPCVVIAPAYRVSIKEPFPAGFNDGFDVMVWAKNNSRKLGIRPDRFVVSGHSGGGGLAAALTLKARDTKEVDVAFQMPIYPMLDDRQESESARDMQVPGWDTEANNFAWNLYLRDLHAKGEEIPVYAAPGRNNNYKDFPPTITLVGDMEPFYDETMSYISALQAEGIEVAYKVFKGCYHAFDALGEIEVAKESRAFTFGKFAEYHDRYITNEKPL